MSKEIRKDVWKMTGTAKGKLAACGILLYGCFAGGISAFGDEGLQKDVRGLFGIGVNQAGWTPASPKWCRIDRPPCADFVLQTIGTDVTWRTVYRGKWIASEAKGGMYCADITQAAAKPGDYRILCGDERENRGGGGGGLPGGFKGVASFFFPVRDGVYDNLERMLVGYCTWQRCGHRKGWAGRCHQDPVPVKDANGNVVRMIDMRGGYHQSADLRCWHDGISMSMYNLLRYAEKASAPWDEDGDIPGNLRWGCDYFLKAIAPEGWLYDCQFVPIGWGPRDYYARPAALGSHANVVMLFARASRYFRPHDAAYADRLLAAAKRLYETMESDPFFETPPKDFVKTLPPGTQPESWYVHQYRTSTLGFAVRSGAALELGRTTGEARYAEQAKTYGLKFIAGLTPDGNSPDFADCSYTHTVSGLTMPTELYREFRDERFREAALRIAARFVRELTDGDFNPPKPRMSSSWMITRARILAMDADVFGRPEYKVLAQRAFDWTLGSNPMCTSFVEGMGQNQWQRPVFGQFFPSTPQIPGGLLHIWGGEYDMPPVTQLLWTLVEL